MLGGGWILWLLMAFGLGGVVGPIEAAPPEESGGSMSSGPSSVPDDFFSAQGVPDCGFTEVTPAGRPAKDPAWQCLEKQRSAGLGGWLMVMTTGGSGSDSISYYLLAEDGTLSVTEESASGNSGQATECQAPTPVWRGCP